MTADIILALIVGVPILLALLFRVSAPLVLLSLAGGVLLQQAMSDSAILAVSGFVGDQAEVVANLGLVWAPLLMTFFFGRKTYPHGSVGLQIIPLATASIAGAVFAIPFMTEGTRVAITDGFFGDVLRQIEDLIVLVAVLLNLMLAWRIFKHKTDTGKGKKAK